jgi:hypothetical protein
MSDLAAFIAVLTCGLFTGASIYINLVEHPARLSCGTEIAATQWAPSYKRATVMQVTLALSATISGIAGWVLGGGTLWLVGSVLIFAVIPFTVVVILPTNNRLLEPNRDRRSLETRRLLERWGWLHGVRSVLSLIAFAMFAWSATAS